MNEAIIVKKKICILGLFGVGKTSLIKRFVHNVFSDDYLSTIGVNISQKIMKPCLLETGNLIQHNFVIWDTEGFEGTDNLKSYYTGAAAAIIVSDLTRMETLDKITDIHEYFKKVNPDGECVIAGNKKDLVEDSNKKIDTLQTISIRNNCDLFLTSAKSGLNVENAFQKISDLLVSTNEQ